ncbi:ribose-phosphate pyrophosphokinase [Candidatus Pacearchaeota archaeon]|nr:ribose-phosphate pyrophosphokinase [Candidatus Pacearchaeota archaeon]
MRCAILLASKNSDAWQFCEKIHEYIKKEKFVDIPICELEINKFRNDEILPRSISNIRGKDVYYIADSSKSPNDWWVEILLVKDLILNASANSLTLVLPDMYYSRQDRKNEPRVPISARALASSIGPGIKKIITMDLHAAQIQGFYPSKVPVDNLYSFPAVAKYLVENYREELKNLKIISPDAGGVERAKSFRKRLGKLTPENDYDIGFMIKQRPRAGEVGSVKYIGESYYGKNVLIVDDIVDSGGTLALNAEVLKKEGAKKIFCYATHGLFTKGTEILTSRFDKVFTSNTRYNKDNIEVIDISSLFAEAIYRAQTNESVSELFE